MRRTWKEVEVDRDEADTIRESFDSCFITICYSRSPHGSTCYFLRGSMSEIEAARDWFRSKHTQMAIQKEIDK